MKITLLDSLDAPRISNAIFDALAEHGHFLSHHRLRTETFAPCLGCWRCWVKHPGTCRSNDAANDVMRDIMAADGLLWLTEPRFGCWDPVAKSALDKSIGLLSPFFTEIDGETHHQPRYEEYPHWAVLGVERHAASHAERDLFRRLVQRNVLNMHGGEPHVDFLFPEAPIERIHQLVDDAVDELAHADLREHAAITPYPVREDAVGIRPHTDRPRRVLLWVGSAKTSGTSTSESLGLALLDRLSAKRWETDRAYIGRGIHLKRAVGREFQNKLAWADLMILSAPVYVDSLPALVLTGLAHLAETKRDLPQAILPIIQSGFPEVQHTRPALEILANAAAAAGMDWAGHLAMGGGPMVDGANPDTMGNHAIHQVKGLDLAAAALDAGSPVPPEATDEFARIPITPRLYRLMGQAGWLAQAWKQNALRHMWDTPFAQS